MMNMLGGLASSLKGPAAPVPVAEPVHVEFEGKTTPEGRLPQHHQGRLRGIAATNANAEEATPWLVTVGEDRDVCVTNGSTGELVSRIAGFTGRPGHPGHTDKVYCVAIWFNPAIQQHQIYTGGEDRQIRVWSLESGKNLQILEKKHTEFIHTLRVNEKTQQLVSASYDKSMIIWSIKTGAPVTTITQDKVLFGCDINIEARAVAGGCGTHVNLWDMASGRRNNVLRLHKRTVVSVAYPRTDLLVSGSDDRTLCIWNPTSETAPLLQRIEAGLAMYALQVYDDGTAAFLLAGSFDAPHSISVYNLESFRLTATLTGHSSKIVDMALWADAEGMPKLGSLAWDANLLTFDLAEIVQAVHDAKQRAKHQTGKFV